MSFSSFPNGTFPKTLVDANDVIPNREDDLSIISSRLGIPSSPSANYANHGEFSGIRGAAYRDTRTLSDNVYSRTVGGSGPLLHVNPGATEYALGSWYNPLGFWEIGAIGLLPNDWRYLDTVWDAAPVGDVTMELRSVGGYVALYVDGTHKVGRVAIPAPLVGATLHGCQLDTSEPGVGTGILSSVEIGTYGGGTLPDYLTPSVETVGTVVKPSGTGTTIDIAHPASVAAGDWLLAVIGDTQAGAAWSASGWTNLGSQGGTTQRVTIMGKFASGGETGNVSFTKSGGNAGLRAGVMLRIDHVNPHKSIVANGQTNSSASTTVGAASFSILGIHRLGLWMAVAPADVTITPPTDWTQAAHSSAGGEAITVCVARRNWDGTVVGTPPLGETGAPTGAQNGSASASTTSATLHANVHGMPGA